MSQTAIPEFFVYGEPARALDVGFLHVETVQARASVHRGRVLAHKHPQMAQITFWTSGSGVYRIEDKTWSFSAPTVSFIPSGVVHGFDIEQGTDAIVVSIADAALAAIAEHSALPLDQPVFVTGRGEVALWERHGNMIKMIQAEYAEAQAGMEKILPALVAVALSGIARLDAQSHAVTVPATVALGGRLRRLIDRHFRDDWPVERYVEELGTTRHLLDKAAHQVLGSGVRQAIGERRLVEAKRLLLFTIRTVEDIAYETGFNDPAYFSRFFRQAVGMAPAMWRRERLGRASSEWRIASSE
ncbi:helix-turn-helix domain-containing protein [Mesorhizobium tamadayense]|uniref:Helix-turn-helix domain-containing protein n=1 Tax=Mesorhizobium tamadayense TaxID=425306 RepID=A0A3P3FIF4_9HYPH|nr:helix-turn-helix domain-containing protein [Mesorhizobium tamadayense]RRH98454.1 helix-turn-helix domain-containing protein [Mesorhizobium tamadayense]